MYAEFIFSRCQAEKVSESCQILTFLICYQKYKFNLVYAHAQNDVNKVLCANNLASFLRKEARLYPANKQHGAW